MDLTVRLLMLSDWHVGTGSGQHGMVDRAVQRDGDGLPFVPAKSLTGVWRDACEIAAGALDDGYRPSAASTPGGAASDAITTNPMPEEASWQLWVEYLFGSQRALEDPQGDPGKRVGRPRPAALRVGSAHYPPSVAAALEDHPEVKSATVFLKPGVALSTRTGAEEHGMLRFEEMARRGASLQASVSLPAYPALGDGQQQAVRALLAAGAGLVEGLGGKRRRGAGRCHIQVEHLDVDWGWLASGPQAPPLPATASPSSAGRAKVRQYAVGSATEAEKEKDAESRAEWETASLRIVLEQPVIAHERTVGNAVRSLDHVPGWTLLPAVLERLATPLAGAAAREGHLVVTNARPEVDGSSGLPVPMAFAHDKGDEAEQRNLLVERPGPGFSAVSYDSGYLSAHEAANSTAGEQTVPTPLRVHRPALGEHMHNTVDDATQRPTANVGGLYSYQALAAGTVLRAQVRVKKGLLPERWPGQLSGAWQVGRSRKDGYGQVRVTASAAAHPVHRDGPRSPGHGGGPLRVWLLSDVLVRDVRLRPSTDPAVVGEVLGAGLGVRLTPSVRSPDGRPAMAASVRRHDPWHARWGLPRESLTGLRAGSCLSFDVREGRLDPIAVARVETSGIGARRAEGFGQVLIGPPLLSSPLGGGSAAAPGGGAVDADALSRGEGGPAGTGDAEGPAGRIVFDDEQHAGPGPGQDAGHGTGQENVRGSVLGVMSSAAWLSEICNSSEAVAVAAALRSRVLGTGGGAGGKGVPASQFGGLRDLLRNLSGPGDAATDRWLKSLTDTRTRRRVWPPAVVEELRRLLTDPDTVWELLELADEHARALTARPLSVEALREALWPRAVQILLENCLAAHANADIEADTGAGAADDIEGSS